MRHTSLSAALTAALALGCSGYDAPNSPGDGGGGANTVSVGNDAFTPSSLSVPVNGTVTWQWNSAGVTHNVTFQGGPTSGDRSEGSFARMFITAGTYPYACTIHAAQGMTGTITVTASGGGGGGGGGSGGGGGDYP